jgi:hypothetical protein
MFWRSTVKVARTWKAPQSTPIGAGFVTLITSDVITGAAAKTGCAEPNRTEVMVKRLTRANTKNRVDKIVFIVNLLI